MSKNLDSFLSLNGDISKVSSDSFFSDLIIDSDNLIVVKDFYDNDFIEQITDAQNLIISIDDLSDLQGHSVSIEFITIEINKIGFYLTIEDFILNNRFEVPAEYYIHEISYSNLSQENNDGINKYKAVTFLIENLITKAKFISEEHTKIIFFTQENSFVEIPIENYYYEEYLEEENIKLINQYVDDINSYKEKRTIFLKELIEFLTAKTKDERLNELVFNFKEFYEKCNTSFEYYLSNFSFNKIQLELDNSVLEYSKNIRSIINESQSKLIAIPAAFVLSMSQLEYSTPLMFKNIIVIISVFLFSYIISIFIKNQKNAIEIISDNLNNHKINYERSQAIHLEEERELTSLKGLIRKSYEKVECELTKQKSRLDILQRCNWGISILLVLSLFISYLLQKEFFFPSWRDILFKILISIIKLSNIL